MKTDVKPPSLLIIDRVFHLEGFALFQHVISLTGTETVFSLSLWPSQILIFYYF